jgi:1,4-alpha-glucan branching enzyme
MWAHPGKKLLFMGTEFGQQREFSETRSLDWQETEQWGHRGVQLLIKDLNRVYRANPALWRHDHDPSGFRWIDADDRGGNTFSFLRIDPAFDDPEDPEAARPEQLIAALVNFSASPRYDLRIGLPAQGRWTEILNTDSEIYDGTGEFGNLGQVIATEVPSHGFDYSATVVVPPLGAVWLRFDPEHPVDNPDDVLTEIAGSMARQAAPEPDEQAEPE